MKKSDPTQPMCVNVDLRAVEALAAMQCTMGEIAAEMRVDRQTLYNRPDISAAIEKGRERGKVRLRQAQWDKAIKDKSVPMLIWLGKQMLGQVDRHEVTTDLSGDDATRRVRDALAELNPVQLAQISTCAGRTRGRLDIGKLLDKKLAKGNGDGNGNGHK